jgi:hypothetical protein
MHNDTNSHGRRPSPAAILLLPVAVALILALFAWPSANLEPRDLPIAVAGPPAAADAIEQQLTARDGAFDVQRYADEAAARDAIEDRDVYGAFVAAPDGAKVLTASAASASVAQLLREAAHEGRAPEAAPVPVEDVVPAPAASTGLGATVLPLIIAGSMAAVISGLLASGAASRAVFVVGGSILVGLAGTVILQDWLGVVGGDWAANAAALSLTVLATAAVVAGLHALLGQPGVVLGALIMAFIGNPLSAVGSAPELLPKPVGELGQLIPPGAGSNLLRSTGYFDGAASGGHVAVLAAWSLAGLALLVAAGLRARRYAPAVAPAPA